MSTHSEQLEIDVAVNEHQRAWWEFRAAHPDVWNRMLSLAKTLAKPGKPFGIEMIFAQIRWREHFAKDGGERFKVNNSWRAYASRDLIATVPALDGLLETRKVRAGVLMS